MNVNVEWVLSTIVAVMVILIGTLFRMSIANRAKLAHHELILAEYKQIKEKIDFLVNEKLRQEEKEREMFGEVRRKFERHEEKEDGQFKEIGTKIETLNVSVALLTHSPLSRTIIGEKASG